MLGGCDKGEGSYVTSLGPTPELVSVRIGRSPKKCTPKPGEAFCFEGVNLRPLFVLQFDRVMALSSGARANFKITSGTSDNLAFIETRVDPVERTVVFRLGPAGRSFLPNTEYRLLVEDSGRPADRLAAFDGAPLRGRRVVRFVTGDGTGGTDATDQALEPEPLDACGAIRVLQAKCSGASCHGHVPTGRTAAPAMGLSLVSHDAIAATAINRASVLVQLASEPASIGEASAKFPYGLPLIAPGASSRSFLLYKILIDSRRKAPMGADGAFAIPPPHPDLALDDPTARPVADPFARTAAELRVRVPGAPMPHDELSPEPGQDKYAPLELSEVRAIRRWIDGGAPRCGGSLDAGVAGDAGEAGDTGEAGVEADATPEVGSSDSSSDASSDAPPGG